MGKYYISTIQKGSKGNDVTEWQNFLNSQGYNLNVDGIFGDATYAATTYWQTKNGLTADGIVGDATWGKAGYSSASTPTSAPTIDPLPNKPTYKDEKWDESTKGAAALGAYNDAKGAVTGYGDYTKGQSVIDAENAYNSHLATKPGAYNSQWQGQLDSLMNSIMNRDKFSYDLNGDALYQQAADRYTQLGKLGMADAIGQASALTGGYGNSYAQSVGQQAYQNQLDNLNDMIPQFYQMALDKYKMEGQDLYNQYGLVADREDMDYGRYMDAVAAWNSERDYLTGRVDHAQTLDYAMYQDKYGRLMDALGIASDDYYRGADMFYDEQSNTNNVLGKEFDDAMAIWTANTNNAWEQAKWDEAARQYVIDQDWKQKEFDADQSSSDGGDDTTNKHNLANEENNPGYDNGGLTAQQIKEMQNFMGIEADGKWGPESTKTAGGLSAKEAWDDYQAGNLETFGVPVPMETKNTTNFINSNYEQSEYLARGHSLAEFRERIENKIINALSRGDISENEALYLIQYYGLE